MYEYVLAIDPGNEQSAYALIDREYKPLAFAKVVNAALEYMLEDNQFGDMEIFKSDDFSIAPVRIHLPSEQMLTAIEMIGHYGSGMPAGKTVFDTCIEIGRLAKLLELDGINHVFIKRKEYVVDLCGSAKAKDTNVTQYLIDRFAPNTPNRGKGSKKEPGWFYGFHADVWQAYALAVYTMDELREAEDGRPSPLMSLLS